MEYHSILCVSDILKVRIHLFFNVLRCSSDKVAQKHMGILAYFQDSVGLKPSLCIWPTGKKNATVGADI